MKRFSSLLLIMVLLVGLLAVQAACATPLPDSVSALAKVNPKYPEAISFDDFESEKANRDANPVSASAQKAISQFAYKTASPILKDHLTNACYSPVSLYFALALASSGADGRTKNELLDLLGFSSATKLSEQSGNLYRQLFTDHEYTQLRVANSLWLDDEYYGEPVHFKEPFIKNAVESFYASLFKVDFAQESTSRAMAKWIADSTNQTLNPAFEPNPEIIMSIINTIYFRDEWVTAFDDSLTKPDKFYLNDGQDVICDFIIRGNGLGEFSRGEGFIRSELPLKSQANMIFVLPDPEINVQDLLSSAARLKDAFEGGERVYGQINWKIPKFAYGSEFELVDILKELGVRAAFEQTADFSGITDHLAFISSIIQNTHIAVDEKGVEASAFSKIDYYGAAKPEGQADMILDRPFLYGIRSATGQLLFIGICGNPA